MIFVFEDKADDWLSTLFKTAYTETTFVYTSGNGNIMSVVNYLLQNQKDDILVMLDTIPDNKDTINIYKALRKLSRKNNCRIIVIPIIMVS